MHGWLAYARMFPAIGTYIHHFAHVVLHDHLGGVHLLIHFSDFVVGELHAPKAVHLLLYDARKLLKLRRVRHGVVNLRLLICCLEALANLVQKREAHTGLVFLGGEAHERHAILDSVVEDVTAIQDATTSDTVSGANETQNTTKPWTHGATQGATAT